MQELLKTEMNKAVKSKFFAFSVLLGIIFIVISAVHMLSLYYSDIGMAGILNNMDEGILMNVQVGSTTLYNNWIGGETLSLGFALFFTLLPVLAMLPCGWNLAEEMHGGYLKVIIPRCGRKNYFLSKIIATFTAGGLSVLIPLVFSLLIIALFIPAIKPNVIYNMYIPIHHGSLFSQVFYSYPMLFTLIYLCIDFIFSGLMACLSISCAFFLRQRAAPIIIPFLVITGCDMARSFLYYLSYIEISPLKLLHAIPEQNIATLPVMTVWLLIFFLLTFPFIIIRGCRLEIY